ncbi:MAG: lysylphosphatidylglycerol synthase domain-containing protein, partial [Sulfuricella sp.]|nr:lysylphosphatidylglycerol synthase domain-containing protein [Sulfuricella sp.]
AALPVGIGGWGTREFAAVLVFGFAGVSGETAAATAILYGLCAVIQGILYAPLFLLSRD